MVLHITDGEKQTRAYLKQAHQRIIAIAVVANVATKADTLGRNIHGVSNQISPSDVLTSQSDKEISLSDSNSPHEGESVLSGGKQAQHNTENGIGSSCLANNILQDSHNEAEAYWVCYKYTGVRLKRGNQSRELG
eukprot:9120053-Ditylum_brightwellii.AAC.1